MPSRAAERTRDSMAAEGNAGHRRGSDHPSAGWITGTRVARYCWSHDMGRLSTGLVLLLSIAGCAVPKVAGAPLAPLERAWEVPTLELYPAGGAKTEDRPRRAADR